MFKFGSLMGPELLESAVILTGEHLEAVGAFHGFDQMLVLNQYIRVPIALGNRIFISHFLPEASIMRSIRPLFTFIRSGIPLEPQVFDVKRPQTDPLPMAHDLEKDSAFRRLIEIWFRRPHSFFMSNLIDYHELRMAPS